MAKEFVGFRLELDVIESIKKQAKKEGRTKSNLMQYAIKKYLESVKND